MQTCLGTVTKIEGKKTKSRGLWKGNLWLKWTIAMKTKKDATMVEESEYATLGDSFACRSPFSKQPEQKSHSFTRVRSMCSVCQINFWFLQIRQLTSKWIPVSDSEFFAIQDFEPS